MIHWKLWWSSQWFYVIKIMVVILRTIVISMMTVHIWWRAWCRWLWQYYDVINMNYNYTEILRTKTTTMVQECLIITHQSCQKNLAHFCVLLRSLSPSHLSCMISICKTKLVSKPDLRIVFMMRLAGGAGHFIRNIYQFSNIIHWFVFPCILIIHRARRVTKKNSAR